VRLVSSREEERTRRMMCLHFDNARSSDFQRVSTRVFRRRYRSWDSFTLVWVRVSMLAVGVILSVGFLLSNRHSFRFVPSMNSASFHVPENVFTETIKLRSQRICGGVWKREQVKSPSPKLGINIMAGNPTNNAW